MDGDFKGDFTRDSFYPIGHYSRVLMQQGRVTLDSDWNEQIDIILHYLRALTRDLIGPHGGNENAGFHIDILSNEKNNFSISGGNYYVDGILVENQLTDLEGKLLACTYKHQPYSSQSEETLPPKKTTDYFVYLDVWERQVTFLEDNNLHNIREVALGTNGPDTTTRAEVAWRVKITNDEEEGFSDLISTLAEQTNAADKRTSVEEIMSRLTKSSRPRLQASTAGGVNVADACITPPDALYRGTENQLYRVEIHRGGLAWNNDLHFSDASSGMAEDANAHKPATFTWSRENASVIFPISGLTEDNHTYTVTLSSTGRDLSRFALNKNDWVEVLGYNGYPGTLLQISNIDTTTMTLTLVLPSSQIASGIVGQKPDLLRLWNYQAGDPKQGFLELADDGAIKVKEDVPLTLEDGIQIKFISGDEPTHYQAGDYWLIPARTITRDIEWPRQEGDQGASGAPLSLTPQGVTHHYAPLAVITINSDGDVTLAPAGDLRRTFKSLTTW